MVRGYLGMALVDVGGCGTLLTPASMAPTALLCQWHGGSQGVYTYDIEKGGGIGSRSGVFEVGLT